MTPAEVRAIVKAKLEQENNRLKTQDRLDGIRCFLFFKEFRSQESHTISTEDFMVLNEKKKSSPEEIARVMDSMANQGGNHG